MVAPRDPVATVGEPIDVAYVRPSGAGDYRVQLVPAGKELRFNVREESADAAAGTVSFPTPACGPRD